MHIALVSVAYPPLSSSGAVQIRDLAKEFVHQGHQVTVFYPDPKIQEPYRFEKDEDVSVLRLKTGATRDTPHVLRAFNEFIMPYLMWWRFKRSPHYNLEFDGVAWYSPSIFFSPLIIRIKRKYHCKSYLILRDIFPEWALDLGLLRKGLAYKFFHRIAQSQYAAADVIGVQTEGNMPFLVNWHIDGRREVEVLHNWLTPAVDDGCSISVSQSSLAGRRIFVYAGNMGLAQGLDILIELAAFLTYRTDIGFLFVGRGSDVEKIRSKAQTLKLNNTIFYDEIPSDEIPGLYAQCDVGLIALDQRHKSHNIPGKFISYMQSGLPVLAIVNPENDLISLINDHKVGIATGEFNIESIRDLPLKLLDEIESETNFSLRCKSLADRMYSPAVAAKQITNGLCKQQSSN